MDLMCRDNFVISNLMKGQIEKKNNSVII